MKKDILKNRYITDLRQEEKVIAFEKQEKDPILNTIFAVDPLTGKPASDLSLVFSSNTPEDVKQYIRTQLATVQHSVAVAPDLETSETSVKRAFETREDYFNRIRDFVQANSISDNKKSE